MEMSNKVLSSSVVLAVMLILGHFYTAHRARKNPSRLEMYINIQVRLRAWWVMLALFLAAAASSQLAVVVFFAILSFFGLREYLSRAPTRKADRNLLFLAYLAIPLQFTLVYFRQDMLAALTLPLLGISVLPMAMLLSGEVHGFVSALGIIHWGLISTVYSVSFIAALAFSGIHSSVFDPGLLLFFVLVTQFNDVAQFCWGKSVGKRPIMPKVSPNKTLEGFMGGLGTTAIVAALVGPYLAGLSWWSAFGYGTAFALLGFFGDVMMSAIKRDIGIKDFSALIPGHGGILDRIDSLLCSAPLFYLCT